MLFFISMGPIENHKKSELKYFEVLVLVSKTNKSIG